LVQRRRHAPTTLRIATWLLMGTAWLLERVA
jgi:hypothetical protein